MKKKKKKGRRIQKGSTCITLEFKNPLRLAEWKKKGKKIPTVHVLLLDEFHLYLVRLCATGSERREWCRRQQSGGHWWISTRQQDITCKNMQTCSQKVLLPILVECEERARAPLFSRIAHCALWQTKYSSVVIFSAVLLRINIIRLR